MKYNFDKGKAHLLNYLNRFSSDEMHESDDESESSEEVEVDIRLKKKMGLTARVRMRANPLGSDKRIISFKQLGLTDPLLPTKSYNSAFDYLQSLSFSVPIYPRDESNFRCIFLPTPRLF